MRKLVVRLWVVYLLTGFPLTIFGYLFTGGGTPQFALLHDYSDPGVIVVWAVGVLLLFALPLIALALTGALLFFRLHPHRTQ
jgi:hypothetical protein